MFQNVLWFQLYLFRYQVFLLSLKNRLDGFSVYLYHKFPSSAIRQYRSDAILIVVDVFFFSFPTCHCRWAFSPYFRHRNFHCDPKVCRRNKDLFLHKDLKWLVAYNRDYQEGTAMYCACIMQGRIERNLPRILIALALVYNWWVPTSRLCLFPLGETWSDNVSQQPTCIGWDPLQ